MSAAARLHHCRTCRRDTEQRFLFAENGYPQGRHVETFRCSRCQGTFLSMGEGDGAVPDAEGLCLWVIDEWYRARRRGDAGGARGQSHSGATTRDGGRGDRWLDLDDLRGHLLLQIVVVWTKWDPARGVPFRAYAAGELRNDLKDWLRTQIGRDRPKPFADALGLDELDGGGADGDGDSDGVGGGGLEAVVGGALDDDAHSLQDLRRVLVRRGRELDELDRERGVGAYARVPR